MPLPDRNTRPSLARCELTPIMDAEAKAMHRMMLSSFWQRHSLIGKRQPRQPKVQ